MDPLSNTINVANAFKNLENIIKVKQRMVYCSTANMRAMVTPLLTSDDLALRTTISSADIYDKELSFLVFQHTNFSDLEGKLDFKTFIDCLSYIDRQELIWGIFTSTYGTLGELDITCPDTKCGHVFKQEIEAEKLIQADSIFPWDKNVPFNEYIYPIEQVINIEGVYKVEFLTSIPTIRQHLDILKLIPPDKLRDNFSKFGTILSKPEELASTVRTIRVYRAENDPQFDQWTSARDIHLVISKYIPLGLADNVLELYNEEFNKYLPKFKTKLVCEKCLKDFEYFADPETSLFRQFLRRE